ncbi:MAG: hypothetical protein ACLVJ6_08510 [Merdibacter sp.]
MKYAPLGNHHLEDFLIEEGFEPVLSGVADFGLYCLENTRIDHRYYHRHALTFPFLTLAQNVLMRMQETFIRLVEEDGTFHAPDRFRDVIRNADGFIDQGVKMGEGWLLTAEIVSLIKEGVSNIVSASLSAVCRTISLPRAWRAGSEAYPQSNLVAIDYDPSASRVNQENRIRLMLANARLSRKSWRMMRNVPTPAQRRKNTHEETGCMSCFSLCVLKGGAAMRYDVLLFDVDDTLLDFGACEQEALHATFARFALPFSPREKQAFHAINDVLWARYEQGEISCDELCRTRFARLFAQMGAAVDPLVFEEAYQHASRWATRSCRMRVRC